MKPFVLIFLLFEVFLRLWLPRRADYEKQNFFLWSFEESQAFDMEFCFFLNRKKDLGGGTILDLGVYTIQFAQFVFKEEPVSITAKGKVNVDGVDVATEVEMKYRNGGVARFKTSALEELSNKANIRGSKNFMTVSCEIVFMSIRNSSDW